MTTTYEQLGQQIGALTDEKNAAYGSSFAKTGDFLRLLYADGIRPEQLGDALLLVRIFDKQMRIATDKDALGESPYQDIAGYGLLGAKQHAERKNKGCGTASMGADEQSTEPSASAASNASELTTPLASDKSEPTPKPPLTQPSSGTSASTAASAPSAMVSVSAREDARVRNKARSILNILRRVGEPVAYHGIRTEMVALSLGHDISVEITCLETLGFVKRFPESGFAITEVGEDYLFRNGVYEL